MSWVDGIFKLDNVFARVVISCVEGPECHFYRKDLTSSTLSHSNSDNSKKMNKLVVISSLFISGNEQLLLGLFLI